MFSDMSPLDSPSDISDFSDEELTIPRVVVGDKEKKPNLMAGLPPEQPPVVRKLLKKKAKSVSPPNARVANGDSPAIAPRTKSPSPGISPRTSPRSSPIPCPRGVKKMLAKVSAVSSQP